MKKLLFSWLFSWLIIICFSFIFIACGGGGSEFTACGGGSSEKSKPETEPERVFFSETIFFSPQDMEVHTGSEFSLEVKVNLIENVFGVGFDIDYDPVFFEYISVEEGDFFGNDRTFLAAVSPMPGELIFGLTRLDKNSGAISDLGLIATLNFKSLNQCGQSEIYFSQNYICILEENQSYYFKNINQQTVSVKVN